MTMDLVLVTGEVQFDGQYQAPLSRSGMLLR
jgi:hypothetical protein